MFALCILRIFGMHAIDLQEVSTQLEDLIQFSSSSSIVCPFIQYLDVRNVNAVFYLLCYYAIQCIHALTCHNYFHAVDIYSITQFFRINRDSHDTFRARLWLVSIAFNFYLGTWFSLTSTKLMNRVRTLIGICSKEKSIFGIVRLKINQKSSIPNEPQQEHKCLETK